MKKLVAAVLFIVCVCSFAPCLAGGAWIAAVPDAQSVQKGGEVQVTVRLGWWEACPGFALLRVSYDSKLMELSFVDILDGRVYSVGGGNGEIALVCRPTDGMSPGDGEFDAVKLTFKALKKGSCAVKPQIAQATDVRWTEISAQSSYTVIGIE